MVNDSPKRCASFPVQIRDTENKNGNVDYKIQNT